MAQESTNKLLGWFKANNGFLHEAVQMKHDSKYGYHFVATSKLPAGTTICVCPANLALSHITAKSEISSILSQKLLLEEQVAFCILEQDIKGPDSFWAPYMEMLPQEKEMTTPLWFDKADLAWLRGTNIYSSAVPEDRTAVSQRKNSAKECYNEGISMLKQWGVDVSKYSLNRFMWALTILESRCFPSNIMFMDLASEEPYPLLYPVMDHFNHRFQEKVTWKTGNGTYGLLLSADIAEGDQIFNNYAPKGNEELLAGYGFCEVNNPCDEVTVALAQPPPDIHQALRDQYPHHFQDTRWIAEEASFRIRGSGHYTGGYLPPALPCLRGIPPMLVMTIQTLVAETFELDDDDPRERAAMLWYATLDSIAFRMKQKIEAIRQFDRKLPKQPNNIKQEYAKIYRDGQLKILEEVDAELNSVLGPLENDDADFKAAFVDLISNVPDELK